jgi:RNA polymerase sigma-70 factor (ECF subfamily)
VLGVQQDDDAVLMQAYAAGDLRAFEQLYARHKGPLYRYLLRQSRDRELANDLFQETWSRVVTSRSRYQVRAKFQTFLYTIAHNCFIDHCRRSAVRPLANNDEADAEQFVPAPSSERPEIQAERSELRERYRAALESLPGEQRDAFLL